MNHLAKLRLAIVFLTYSSAIFARQPLWEDPSALEYALEGGGSGDSFLITFLFRVVTSLILIGIILIQVHWFLPDSKAGKSGSKLEAWFLLGCILFAFVSFFFYPKVMFLSCVGVIIGLFFVQGLVAYFQADRKDSSKSTTTASIKTPERVAIAQQSPFFFQDVSIRRPLSKSKAELLWKVRDGSLERSGITIPFGVLSQVDFPTPGFAISGEHWGTVWISALEIDHDWYSLTDLVKNSRWKQR